jgi:type III pantothenate kinase
VAPLENFFQTGQPVLILVVDAGNSRVKWALHDGRSFVHDGRVAHAELDALDAQWSSLPEPSSIVIANVAQDEIGLRLRHVARRWKAKPRVASSRQSQAGVTNLYNEPALLGVDRWAAMIAARKFTADACVVVNAGTAMTVDALTANGEFIGGIIVPGFDMMHDALATGTARLSAQRGDFTPFPRTTRDAITSGTIQALCGAVERMRGAMLAARQNEPVLIFSGGAGELIAQYMGRPVRVIDNLVLEGLVQIAMEPQ